MSIRHVTPGKSVRREAAVLQRSVSRIGLVAVVVAVSGCDLLSGPEDADHSIRYEVDVLEVFEESHDWTPVPITYLRAGLRGVNQTGDSVHVGSSNCIPDLMAFQGSELAPPAEGPSWALRDRLGWPGGTGFGCFGGIRASLGPGDTMSVSTESIPLAEILADSLASGPYRFQVQVSGEVTVGASAKTDSHLVDLGVITLPKSRHPLSVETYPRDGFYYRVEVLSGDPVEENPVARLTVTHLARNAGALTRDLSLNCPVRFLAFRTAAEREEIPVPRPAWRSPSLIPGCGDASMPVRLAPGSEWRLESAIPRGAYAHTGLEITDFFLMAIIEVDGRAIRLAVNPK